ncbi:MAG: GGDEF domain-containing protein [Fibrobacter sp.]|nr:GGDEF domain-containing protein [Fibrobacter sp.]
MIALLKRKWNNLETLEQKLFWIVQVIFLVVSLAGTLITVVEEVSDIAELVLFIDLVVCILVGLFVMKTSHYSVGFFILIFFYTTVSTPLLFFLCSGVDSAMPYYMLLGPFMSSFISSRKIRYISAVLTMLVGIALYAGAWFFPHLLVPAPSKGIVYLDFAANFVLVGGSIFFICSFAINAYVREKVQRERLVTKLDYQAKHDDLTELYNRRYVIQYLENIVWHSRERYYMFMFTIDGLKELGDSYGHVVADRIVCNVAHALWETVNENVGECGARYGEETFLFIMAADSDVDAFMRADKFREKISGQVWSNTPDVRISVSGGVVPCRDENEFDRERLLKKVDALLDGFKSRGKNQVRIFMDVG